MLDLDITRMVNEEDMGMLSGSIAELGERAGAITWGNSLEYAADHPLLETPDQIQEARDYVKGFGAWDDEEIAGWTDDEVQALIVQLIAGEIREMEHYDDYEAYVAASQAGQVSGSIYQDDAERWHISLDS